MPWIESHTTLARHPKTLRLARHLGLSVPCAIGHLHLLWWWALEYADDGDLSTFDAEEIALACMWEGDPEQLLAALSRSGFLDDAGAIHDWYEYAGKLVDRRRANADRMRDARQQARAADVPSINSARATHVQRTSGARAGATVPNLTKPNQPLTDVSGAPDADAPDATPAKTKTRAAPKPEKDKTPPHPAFKVVREVLHFTPDETQRTAIREAVGEDEDALTLFLRCCQEWRLRGFNVRNLSGVLDWFRDDGPPPAAPRERLNGHVAGRGKAAPRNEPPPLPGPVVPASPEVRAEYDAIRDGRRVKPVQTDPDEFQRKKADALAQAQARIGAMP